MSKSLLCLSLFICLCWFISLRNLALFACSLLDSLPPAGIEWPRCPGSKYEPIFNLMFTLSKVAVVWRRKGGGSLTGSGETVDSALLHRKCGSNRAD